MNHAHTFKSQSALRGAKRLHQTAAALAAALLISACGGGGDAATTEGAGNANVVSSALAYTTGTVEGLGSVVVNGVRFDDSSARITDDAGRTVGPDQLTLGMRVEVLAPPAQTGADGVSRSAAQTVRYSSELDGPISELLPEGLVVLGHTVRYGSSTVFEDGRSLTLRVGQVVEVHGMRDAQGVVQASLIETEDDRDEEFKVVGTLTAVDAAQSAIWIDGVRVSYAGLTVVPEISVGQRVRVELVSATPNANGWVAKNLRVLQPLTAVNTQTPGTAASGVEVDVEGLITRLDSASRFVVAGVVVDASQVRALPTGLAAGDAVEVEGRLTEGVLLARQVERERQLDADDEGFEVEGAVTALDITAQTLVLRGITVAWGNARFEDGTAQQLAVGRRLDVKGTLSAEGSRLLATEIEFD